MAKIKLKIGDNEIEVDSRDFYVDNQTLGKVIENISKHMQDNHAQIVYESPIKEVSNNVNYDSLNSLEDAETFEPEFNEPKVIRSHEIKGKLKILETSGFFNYPRTVTETVQQLREYGWASSPLDVSKALAKMASNKEIAKNSKENRTHYFIDPLTAI